MVSHGEHRWAMVRIGNGLAPAARDHYQLLPPGQIIKYTHMNPIDYIGLYIIVIAASCVTVNILYRLYF